MGTLGCIVRFPIACVRFLITLLGLVTGISVVVTAIRFQLQRRANPVKFETIFTLPRKVKKPPQGTSTKATVVFVHGWPDDINLFDVVIDDWCADGYECWSVSLPLYALPEDFNGDPGTVPKGRNQGFTFPEVAYMLRATIRAIDPVGKGVVLVGHDLGAIYSYTFIDEHEQDSGITRLITLDVGIPHYQRPSFRLLAGVYQGYLNLAFLLSPEVGTVMARFMARAGKHIKRKNAAPIDSESLWPYRRFWAGRNVCCGTAELRALHPPPKNTMHWLFAHGSIGTPNFMHFYDEHFLNSVRESSELSRVMEYDGGHWFFLQPDHKFILDGKKWLNDTDHVSPRKGASTLAASATGISP